MRVGVLFSGGKDSTLAAFVVMSRGWEAELITVLPEGDTKMFHKPNLQWTALQGEAMGLKHHFIKSRDDMEGVKKFLLDGGFEGVVSGAIASEYQKQKIDMMAESIGIPSFSPLWHKEKSLMEDIKEMEIYITSVAAEGLGEELLGKRFSLPKTKYPIHPLLEGGEGETFVADAPFFKRRIKIEKWRKVWDGIRGEAIIEEAHLEDKP